MDGARVQMVLVGFAVRLNAEPVLFGYGGGFWDWLGAFFKWSEVLHTAHGLGGGNIVFCEHTT